MKVSVLIIAACMMTLCFSFVNLPASAAVEGWQDAIMIQPNIEYTQCDTLHMDDQGNALIVWEQPWGNFSDPAIWARQYNRVTGWNEPEKIFDGEFWWGYTTMSMSPNGRAIAAWGDTSDTGDSARLYARFFNPISGWGETHVMVDGIPGIGMIAVAISNDGDAAYIWSDPFEPYISVYDHETGWGPTEIMSQDVSDPVIKFDDFGNALLVWSNRDSDTIEASRYVPGEGWSEAVTISGILDASGATMDMDHSGNAMAVWTSYDGSTRSISASSYTPSDGWTESEVIGPAENGLYPNGISVDTGADGEFFVIWQQTESATNVRSIWGTHWLNTSGWDVPDMISVDGHIYNTIWPSLAANQAGQASAVWTQGNEDTALLDVSMSRYTPGLGWSAPKVIDNSDTLNAWMGRIAIDPLGNNIATWKLDLGQCYLWGAEYKAYWAPDVMISEPLDGTTTDSSPITVRGFAEIGATLVVNGMSVPVETDGSYEVNIELSLGSNMIVVRAMDDVGNYTETSITVTFAGESNNPTAVIEASSTHNWKLWRFDGRESTDDVKVAGYLWDFGDGTYSTSTVTVHKYQKAGVYLVTLTVWDDDGGSDTASVTIIVGTGGSSAMNPQKNLI